MKQVYLLQSIKCPEQRYIGIANDPGERLKKHNARQSAHTSKYVPWKLRVAIRFEDDCRATQFERYLKSGSGRAFARKHFW